LIRNENSRLAAYVSATGSAGTIAAGDYLRPLFPNVKVVASEALQCPTLLRNGFGAHRIEGIGDKHVPWIHNVKNTNMVSAIDDEDPIRLLRLFNCAEGHSYLKSLGFGDDLLKVLPLMGISSIANVLAAIKTANYYEMDENDVIITIATDSVDMYHSRIKELEAERGAYTMVNAAVDYERRLLGQSTDNMKELSYLDQKAIHNLKYFTWVEQQGKEVSDLNILWYDHEIWGKLFNQLNTWDSLIDEFNDRTGLLKEL